MTDATACKECGGPLVRKSRGPLPTYCSAPCKAEARDRRDKASGAQAKLAERRQAKRQAEREANAKPCPHCGDPMLSSRRVQCGKPECKRLYTNARMRDFLREYKAEHGDYYQRRFRAQQIEQTCQECGAIFLRANLVRSCSPECQQILKRRVHGRKQLRKQRIARARARLARAAHGTRGAVTFIAGPCGSCGVPIVSHRLDARWCSIECKRRQKAARRRARERQAFVEDISPRKIFERDKWICQLCHHKVKRNVVVPHPDAPVIDHVIPLARGGMHEATNAQCAHFICNSIKGDRGGGEQLMLIG